MSETRPLISCVMPTWNRRAFIPAAVDCWQKQTYQNRELVILDDGEEPIEDLLPDDPRIRYVFDRLHRCTGDKRNRVCEMAKGPLICHWDDDDYSEPGRLEYQLQYLLETKKQITGFSNLLFWDMAEQKAKKFHAAIAGYVCGTTLLFYKEFWAGHRFKLKQVASDNDFIYPNLRHVAASKDQSFMVARIHQYHHTSPKTGVRGTARRDEIPAGFWENEKLRLSQ